MRYLDEYYDAALEVDLTLTPEQLAAQEAARLAELSLMASYAAQVPRRLSMASAQELALDKRRGRRIAWALEQARRSWTDQQLGVWTDETRQAGAQVNWESWFEEQRTWLTQRIRYVATWAKKSGVGAEGRSAVRKLRSELSMLEYALRD